jgi:hypothetical protein
MDIGWLFQMAGTIGGIASPVLFLMIRSSAQKYTDKKAENLATIQDTGKITDQVERIKSDYQMWFQASRFVYEREYALLGEVWKESWELQAKARSLTPVFDRVPEDVSERKEELLRRYESYTEQVKNYKAAVIKVKPFIPDRVYCSSYRIWEIVASLQVTFTMSFQGMKEPDWLIVEESCKNLDAELEQLCQEIRNCVFDRPTWFEGKLTPPST